VHQRCIFLLEIRRIIIQMQWWFISVLPNGYRSRDIRRECILSQLYRINGSLFDVTDSESHKHITRTSKHIVQIMSDRSWGISRRLITSRMSHLTVSCRASRVLYLVYLRIRCIDMRPETVLYIEQERSLHVWTASNAHARSEIQYAYNNQIFGTR